MLYSCISFSYIVNCCYWCRRYLIFRSAWERAIITTTTSTVTSSSPLCRIVTGCWLSRFKLIRLRRISLATFADEWAEGWAEGWILIYYWLPPAGGRIRSQGNKDAPTAQSWMNGGMGGGMGGGIANDMYNNDVGKGGSICLWSLWSKIKGGGL